MSLSAKALLRIELLKIAHHHAQGVETTLQIARELEQFFDDVVIDDDKAQNAPPAAARVAKK